jgi:prepilin-type N-terminal cleavage/methylation domain-containing protein
MKKITSQIKTSGFSLIEAMITVAIIALIAMVAINQNNFVSKARTVSNSKTVINNLRDKIVIALANETTCTLNFKAKPLTLTTINSILDASSIPIVTQLTNYGVSADAAVLNDGSKVDTVRIDTITTELNPLNTNELNLTIVFLRKNGIAGIFSSKETFTLPLTLVKDTTGTAVDYCFSDSTMAAATAIRLSCQGNSSYYNPDLNRPYGQCEHKVQTAACPPGQFMKKVGINLSGIANNLTGNKTFEYKCMALESTCPPKEVLMGINTNGTVSCGKPFESCSLGQMMVKGASGRFVCVNTNVGCSGLYAIKEFKSDGTVTCAPFFPPQTCSGLFVTSYSPTAGMVCGANVRAKTCAPGSFISSFSSDGTPACTPWVKAPSYCPPGQGATRIDSSGNLICQKLDRRLTCGGSVSGRTFKQCEAAGGAVVDKYIYGSANSYCQFISNSCPGGWAQCQNYKMTFTSSCSDSNSACAHSAQYTRYAYGTYSWNNSPANTTQCIKWLRNSGPWVMSCTASYQPPVSATTFGSGCY